MATAGRDRTERGDVTIFVTSETNCKEMGQKSFELKENAVENAPKLDYIIMVTERTHIQYKLKARSCVL